MKTSKRILATIVAIMLVVTSMAMPTFAAFTDLAEGASSYTAVDVLSKLGVVNGYDDGAGNFSFKPENNVTRAEFTAMLLRTRGMGSVGSTSLENPPFPDVTTPDVSWAIANIRTAREMGIINGYDDGTFKPNNNVSYEEAVKMIVCALGYGNMGVDGEPWYSKYMQTATSLRFLDGAGGAIATPATRATIASMLYNCLEVKLAEDNKITDKTILEDDLGLTKNVGFISANPEISLVAADSNLRADEVQITAPNANGVQETAVYKVDDNSKYNDMLGAQITFYYTIDRNSNFKHLLMATVKDSETLDIPAGNIYDSTSSSIEYLKNEDDSKTTTVSVDPKATVVYNGKLYNTATYDTFEGVEGMPSIGSVKLLDRNGDNKYDVVFVEDYETWVVSSVTASDMTIVDNVLRTTNNKLVLDPEKAAGSVKIVDKAGKETTFSSIKKGSVVSVKTDKYGNIIAVVTNESVSGKITATDSKKGLTINGKTYKLSNQAVWGADGQPKYGDSGKYYLDIDGNIVAYDKTEAAVTQYYGYLSYVGMSDDTFNPALNVVIISKKDTKGNTPYTVTTKSKIDGASVTDLDATKTALASKVGEGVKFTLGKGNEIDEIITATASALGEGVQSDKLYLYSGAGIPDENASWEYSWTGYVLNNTESGKSIRIGNADTIICVENKDYRIMSLNEFISNATGYKVEAYDMSSTGAAKFLIVHTEGINEDHIKATSPIVYVESTQRDINSEGEPVVKLNAYLGKTSKQYTLSSKNIEDVQEGDIVRLREKGGETTVSAVIFREADRSAAVRHLEEEGLTDSSGNVKYRAMWGSAYLCDDETGSEFIMSTDVLTAGDSEPAGKFIFQKSWFNSAKILEYDVTEDEFTDMTEDGYEGVLGSLICSGGEEAPSEIFVYMNSNTSVATMVIITNRP